MSGDLLSRLSPGVKREEFSILYPRLLYPLSSTLYPPSSFSYPPRVRNEDPINRANQIRKAAGRIREEQRSVPERRKNIFNRQRQRARDARIIRPKGVEPMSVGRRDQRFLELGCDLNRAAIWIEKRDPK